jgi:uncharacterized protein (UPF0333 family)
MCEAIKWVSMVSRSLEKMMLIAIGLSTVVIIGVPVLLFAIDTMSYTSHLQDAQAAANDIFEAINRLDSGELNNLTIQVHLPTGMAMTINGHILTISVLIGEQQTDWSQTFSHQIIINPPTEAGYYSMVFTMASEVIHITYSLISF